MLYVSEKGRNTRMPKTTTTQDKTTRQDKTGVDQTHDRYFVPYAYNKIYLEDRHDATHTTQDTRQKTHNMRQHKRQNKTWHNTQDTTNKTQHIRHSSQDRRHKTWHNTQDTTHKTQHIRHKTQDRKHKTQDKRHKSQTGMRQEMKGGKCAGQLAIWVDTGQTRRTSGVVNCTSPLVSWRIRNKTNECGTQKHGKIVNDRAIYSERVQFKTSPSNLSRRKFVFWNKSSTSAFL